MALTLTLERTVLNNVDDAAGRWQFEGGKVFEDKRDVGFYASTKRVVFGATDAQNTAMLTLEVFFLPNKPPQNIVLQGYHRLQLGRRDRQRQCGLGDPGGTHRQAVQARGQRRDDRLTDQRTSGIAKGIHFPSPRRKRRPRPLAARRGGPMPPPWMPFGCTT